MVLKDRKVILAGIAIFLLITAFLWSARSVLSPILIGVLLIYFLGEVQEFPLMRRLRTGIAILLLVWMVVNAQGIIIPFLIAFSLAYLINPLVDLFERIRIPRLLAVSILFAGAAGFIVLAWFTLIPDLIREIQDLIVRMPKIIQDIIAFAHQHLPKLFNVLNIDYLKIEKDFMQNQYPAKVESLMLEAIKALSNMGTLLSQVLNVILIPVLTFYLLKDYNKIKGGFLSFVPKKRRPLVNFYLWRSNRIFGGYIRGKLIIGVFVGIFTWLGLFLFGIPYSIMIGIVTGILNFVPFVGFYISIAVALFPALFMPNPLHAVLRVLIVFAVVQSIEGYVISPKIVGDRVGLHPVAVIFSVLIFSHFLGFWGLLFAVPVAALLKFLLNEWKRHQDWKELLAEKIRNVKT
jgi:predicted PurR-regulated permease PerM